MSDRSQTPDSQVSGYARHIASESIYLQMSACFGSTASAISRRTHRLTTESTPEFAFTLTGLC